MGVGGGMWGRIEIAKNNELQNEVVSKFGFKISTESYK